MKLQGLLASIGLLLISIASSDSEEQNPIKVNAEFSKIPELKDDMIQDFASAVNNDEEHFLFFYAEWCPACHDFKPALNLLVESEFFDNHGISVYRVDVIQNPELTARFLITSLPSLVHVRDRNFRDITKKRWKLIEYFDEKQWSSVEPFSPWKNPLGTFATFLGVSTKLGHRLAKDAESMNWPKWKWVLAFIVSFGIAWAPAIYLSMLRRDQTITGKEIGKESNDENNSEQVNEKDE